MRFDKQRFEELRSDSLINNEFSDLSDWEKERYADLHAIHTLRVEALIRRRILTENFVKKIKKLVCCEKEQEIILRELDIYDY